MKIADCAKINLAFPVVIEHIKCKLVDIEISEIKKRTCYHYDIGGGVNFLGDAVYSCSNCHKIWKSGDGEIDIILENNREVKFEALEQMIEDVKLERS